MHWGQFGSTKVRRYFFSIILFVFVLWSSLRVWHRRIDLLNIFLFNRWNLEANWISTWFDRFSNIKWHWTRNNEVTIEDIGLLAFLLYLPTSFHQLITRYLVYRTWYHWVKIIFLFLHRVGIGWKTVNDNLGVSHFVRSFLDLWEIIWIFFHIKNLGLI